MEKKNQGKNPWQWIALAVACLSGGYLMLYLVMQKLGLLLHTLSVDFSGDTMAASIGVIGGADGPTAIFVTRQVGTDWEMVMVAAVLAVSILALLGLRKSNKK